jgi:hypothetical protein
MAEAERRLGAYRRRSEDGSAVPTRKALPPERSAASTDAEAADLLWLAEEIPGWPADDHWAAAWVRELRSGDPQLVDGMDRATILRTQAAWIRELAEQAGKLIEKDNEDCRLRTGDESGRQSIVVFSGAVQDHMTFPEVRTAVLNEAKKQLKERRSLVCDYYDVSGADQLHNLLLGSLCTIRLHLLALSRIPRHASGGFNRQDAWTECVSDMRALVPVEGFLIHILEVRPAFVVSLDGVTGSNRHRPPRRAALSSSL